MTVEIIIGDCRDVLQAMPDESIDCVVTSPPYFGLRDYGVDGQIGKEQTPEEFVGVIVEVFREVHRVLRDDGTLWLNIGDSYATGTKAPRKPTTIKGSEVPASWAGRSQPERCGTPEGYKTKDILGIPWRVAFALQADGWFLRQDLIWSKPNPMPESVRDRCTKAHEYLFLLSKSERYFFDADAIAEPLAESSVARLAQNVDAQSGSDRVPGKTNGRMKAVTRGDALRNRRSVWTVATQPFKEAHFATFPPALIEPCILAGCPTGGTVLDPFGGAGTTGLVADRVGRNAILIELNPAYADIAKKRVQDDAPLLAEVSA